MACNAGEPSNNAGFCYTGNSAGGGCVVVPCFVYKEFSGDGFSIQNDNDQVIVEENGKLKQVFKDPNTVTFTPIDAAAGNISRKTPRGGGLMRSVSEAPPEERNKGNGSGNGSGQDGDTGFDWANVSMFGIGAIIFGVLAWGGYQLIFKGK